MNIASRWHVISTGLAIFSMFFGAGNLMYPIIVGISSGQYMIAGLFGFLITAGRTYCHDLV
jgi:LIVCS family branched-chain amino acid:cation transporter